MISICIPVYNTDVNELVNSLIKEINHSSLKCEIILIDDGSDKKYLDANRLLKDSKLVNYSELQHNVGRAEIRKILGAIAQYEWFLFIDADSKIISEKFILNYLSSIATTIDVIVGGRVYNQEAPSNCSLRLHWKYGRKREKYDNSRFVFMTNNFLIRKVTFQQIHFPAELQGYGHEDTWMGMKLKDQHAKITFIDNPVLHDGLETANIFLDKTKNAIKNLIQLEKMENKETIVSHVKILRLFYICNKFALIRIFVFIEALFHQTIFKNLNSCNPSLFLFDFYRLALLANLKRNNLSAKN